MRIVVPAHNEEAVIGGLLRDLAASDYPTEAAEIWVSDRYPLLSHDIMNAAVAGIRSRMAAAG